MDDMGGGMGGDMGGGDEEMMTIHGTTDGGGEFEFSFDPSTLGFDGDEAGGGDMGGDDMGGDDMGGDDGDMDDHGGGGDSGFGGHKGSDKPGFGSDEDDDNPVHEAAARKPGKGKRGMKTARMAVVPKNPATSGAAPFPTPQGTRQKRK
jgi:hypothetical protein